MILTPCQTRKKTAVSNEYFKRYRLCFVRDYKEKCLTPKAQQLLSSNIEDDRIHKDNVAL